MIFLIFLIDLSYRLLNSYKLNFLWNKFVFSPDCSVSPQDLQSVGRVYIYKYPLSKPLMSLSGKSEFEQFGYDFDLSFQMGSSILAVSSIGKDVKLDNRTSFNLNRAGQVQLFQIDNSLLKINLISIIKSDRPYASFGSRIKVFQNFNFWFLIEIEKL